MNESSSTLKSLKRWIIFLSLVIVGAIAKIVYDTYDKSRITAESEAKGNELQDAYTSLDSVQLEIEQRIAQISQLGGQVDTLNAVLEELEYEKEQLRSRSRAQIAGLKEKVESYTSLLLEKDQEIVRLRETNQILSTENTELKTQQTELTASVSSLEADKRSLEAEVAIASRLEISPPVAEGLSSRGRRLRKLRRRTLKTLRISFEIEANPIAEPDGKDILLRIVAPNGKEIFDVDLGSGSFVFQGKERYYTAKQGVLYQKVPLQVSFLYEKGSRYEKGTYQVEVYTEDYLMGKSSFEVK